ncbi:MAG TPA: hypothetical protein DCQ31_10600, partial [Bacteroidales bacterium]|nr:hypothetical protein [Bacteroidales bacterium]
MQDEMRVVSASRTAKSVKELPVTVYVITRAEILANGYTTLADVLKSLPGIKVQQPATGDEGEKFSMRGLSGNYYTKILVNNVAVLPSVLNGMPISAQLPIRQAERIEIIYGAASAIYGSDAAAGVINIVTKMPESLSFAQADAVIGNNGYNYSNFSVGGKTGKNRNILQYTIYGNRMQFSNMNLKSEMDTLSDPMAFLTQMFSNITANGTQLDTARMYDFFGGEKSFYDLYNTWAESDFKIKYAQNSEAIGTTFKYRNWSGSLDYMHRSNENTLNALALLVDGQGESSNVGEAISRMSVTYSLNRKKWAAISTLSYLRMRSDRPELIKSDASGGGTSNYLASDDLIFDQLAVYNYSESMEIVAGVQYKMSGNFILSQDFSGYLEDINYNWFDTDLENAVQALNDAGITPYLYHNGGVFAQMVNKIGKFSFILGTRFDYDSRHGGSSNPRFAVLYSPNNKFSFRVSAGTAFKAPSIAVSNNTFRLNFADDSLKQTTKGQTKFLQPETARTFEAGYRHQISRRSYLDIAIYNSSLQNLIATEVGNQSLTATDVNDFVSENVKDANSVLFGIQVLFTTRNIIPSIKLNTDIN